jgi:hypothetical protein
VCQKLLGEVEYHQNCLSRVTTGDRPWIYCYILETNSGPLSGKAHLPHVRRKKRKSAQTSRAYCEGIAHHEFVPSAQLINHCSYEGLQCLRVQVHQKCLEQWWNQDWLIYHDGILEHAALSVQQFLATKNSCDPAPSLVT